MKNDKCSEYVTRDSILKLLSDQEVASVTTAETAAQLPEGDEYLDLEQLECGVQRASRTSTVMGRVLPRKAVHEHTWSKILAQLATACKGTIISEPKIADKKPAVLDLAAGSYWWCACGHSKKQPFCDGAHKQGTGMAPQEFKLDKPQRVALCQCKRTAKPPFCDGTHQKL